MTQQHVHRACTALAAVLWTMAVATMAGALDGEPNQLAEAAIMCALAACVPTVHLVIEYALAHSRQAMAEAIDQIAEAHRQQLLLDVLEVVGRADAERDLAHIGPQR